MYVVDTATSTPVRLGARVGAAVGATVGAAVGDADGDALGAALGAIVGDAVGAADGAAVGANVLYPKNASVLVCVTADTTKLTGVPFMVATASCTTDVLTLSGSNIIVTDVTGPELTTTSIDPP